jgi:hypothetical protein
MGDIAMNTIYKYPLSLADAFELEQPEGAMFLACGVQGDQPVAWFKVDPNRPHIRYKFCVATTGGAIPAGLYYLGTFQIASKLGWPFVGHLFEYEK